MTGIFVPEPTKSLLWVTNEDTSKISSPMSIKITISLQSDGAKMETDDGHNFYGEPSLIAIFKCRFDSDNFEIRLNGVESVGS